MRLACGRSFYFTFPTVLYENFLSYGHIKPDGTGHVELVHTLGLVYVLELYVVIKQTSWDLKTADMKYHTAMAKYKGISLRHKGGKVIIKHFQLSG